MRPDVEKLTGKLGELQGERATLAAARTRDDAVRAAKEYADAVRHRHAELGGFVLGGAIMGDPLNSLMVAYIASRPDFEAWLAEQAKAVCGELSDRQRDAKLKSVDGEIAKVTVQLREARKAEAFERIESEFAGEAA